MTNTANTGEITSSLPTFDAGRDYRPDLDGSNPQGTPADFAGLTPWPGSSPAPAHCGGHRGIPMFFWARSSWRVFVGEPAISTMVLSADSTQADLVGARGTLGVKLTIAGHATLVIIATAEVTIKVSAIGRPQTALPAIGTAAVKLQPLGVVTPFTTKGATLVLDWTLDSFSTPCYLVNGSQTVKLSVSAPVRLLHTVTVPLAVKLWLDS